MAITIALIFGDKRYSTGMSAGVFAGTSVAAWMPYSLLITRLTGYDTPG